jgi:hypothetical protein
MTNITHDAALGDNSAPPTSANRVFQVRKGSAATSAPSKAALATKLLTRARGATMAELGTATGWQPHSVRALLSGLRKKGVKLVKETRKSGEGHYRIEPHNAPVIQVEAAAPVAAEVA